MTDSVIATANKINQELRNGYNISGIELDELDTKVKNIKVVLMDADNKEIHYDFYTENDGLYGTFVTKQFGQSHTAEYPPVLLNGKLVPIIPLVNLLCYADPMEFLASTYHELIHYFSIGKWNIISANKNVAFTLEHYSGIIRRQYLYFENDIECQSQEITMLNETITDWIAQFLYAKIEGGIYHSGLTYRNNFFYDYLLQRIEKKEHEKRFIGAYITNKIDTLQTYLLDGCPYKNFEALNDVLVKGQFSNY